MKIRLYEIFVRDLAEGYMDDSETGGIVGHGGKLNI